MNLSYIVNNIKSIITKNNVIKTVHHIYPTLESGNGTVAECAGCNTMTIRLTGPNASLRTFNIYVEGEAVTDSNVWVRIPVYNSNLIKQPYISVIYSGFSHPGYISSVYFANITGYSKVRTRLEYISGSVGIGVESEITNAPFQVDGNVGTIRSLTELTSLTTRSYEYIGRPFGSEGAKTDPANLYPVWIGNPKFCEIVVTNNMSDSIYLMAIYMHDTIDAPVTRRTYKYDLRHIEITPGSELRINSIEYPMLVAYPGMSFYMSEDVTTVGERTGTYNLKINVR